MAMGVGQSGWKGRWYLNLGLLKWVTIILPILVLASVDWLRHTLLVIPLHTPQGFISVIVVMGIAVSFFSFVIFAFINRLQLTIVDQNRRLSALNDIAKATVTKLRLEQVLEESLSPILSSMKSDSGLICLVDAEKEEHSVVCYSGFSPELVKMIQKAKLKDDPIGLEVVRTKRPVVIERVFEDARVSEIAKREGFKSTVSAPITTDGVVTGILAMAMNKERHFSDADYEFLKDIGNQLGMAIGNAKLYEQLQLQNRELSALLAIGKVTTSSFELQEVLSRSLDTVIELTSADAAEVWIMEDDDELVLKCHGGTNYDAFFEQTHFHVSQGIPGIVAHDKEPILIHDLPADTRFLRRKVIETGFHTFCALPLIYQDKVVGVLTVAALSANAINGQRDLDLLKGISEWLALATENARLYNQVQDIAVMQERERIAREMHDGMAQLLGYISTQTIAVKKLLSDERYLEVREELSNMEEITHDLYTDVREGILGLRIASQSQDGLLPAVREYTERFMEMAGIQVEISLSPDAERTQLAPSVEVQLIRIIQEALTNVRKHSKASVVGITFEYNSKKPHGLRVTISDNGCGFDLTHLPSVGRPRFGLSTMRERAEAIGGSLTIETEPERGTKVKVHVPALKRSNHEPE